MPKLVRDGAIGWTVVVYGSSGQPVSFARYGNDQKSEADGFVAQLAEAGVKSEIHQGQVFLLGSYEVSEGE